MKNAFNFIDLRGENLSEGSAEPSVEDGPSIRSEDEQGAVTTAAPAAMKLVWRQTRAVTSLAADNDMSCN